MKLSKDIDQVSLQGVDAPGPGQYLNSKSKNLLSSVGDVNPTLKSPGGVKFGTAERKSMVNDASSGDVGPGEYNLLYSRYGQSRCPLAHVQCVEEISRVQVPGSRFQGPGSKRIQGSERSSQGSGRRVQLHASVGAGVMHMV